MAPLFPEVVVDGQTIPAAAIAAEAQNHQAPSTKPGWAWRKAAQALAIRALLLREAARRGLSPAPRDLGGGRRETEEESLIRLLLEDAIEPEAPQESEIRAVYEVTPDRVRSPDLFEAAHILFAAPADDAEARASAWTRAATVLSVLREQPEIFDRLAREQSSCSSREAGGRLGQISTGDTVPEFEAALAKLGIGEIAAEPVETEYGIHIIRLDSRAEGSVLPYDTVRAGIAGALEKAAWAKAARAFLERLAGSAEISGVQLRRTE